MRLLALDTSTEACSVALLLDGVLRLRFEITERSHADLVLPMVDELLAEAGVALADLDGLAFGRGPGAFTGLRIATGVVQGLALGADLPVAAVSSLAAVAEQVPAAAGETMLVCNDARMGEVYWGVYRREDAAIVRCDAGVRVRPGHGWARARRRFATRPAMPLPRYPALATRLLAEGLQLHDGIYPRADAVARLGALELAAGRGVPAEMALPVYIRDDVARPVRADSSRKCHNFSL